MRKKYTDVSDKVKLIGNYRNTGESKVIDYYLEHPKWGREYAFTRKHTYGTYSLVKNGIPVKKLLQIRTKDKPVMNLVKYTSLMMSYFMEEIEWMVA